MRKIFYLFLIPILFAGCNKERETLPEPAPVGGMISVRSQKELSNESQNSSAIRSDAFSRAADAAVTYTFEAWTHDANPRCVLHKSVTGTLTEAAFEIALIPGNYDFLFWADYGKGAYATDNPRQVTATTAYTLAAASERDAFACAKTGVTWNGGNGVSATLMRPMAKLTMQNTSPFATDGKMVSITYRNTPTQYDVLTGTSSAPAAEITLPFPTTTAGSAAVGEDFIFVPAEGKSVGLTITVGDVEKELDALPLKPNYITNVTAVFE